MIRNTPFFIILFMVLDIYKVLTKRYCFICKKTGICNVRLVGVQMAFMHLLCNALAFRDPRIPANARLTGLLDGLSRLDLIQYGSGTHHPPSSRLKLLLLLLSVEC